MSEDLVIEENIPLPRKWGSPRSRLGIALSNIKKDQSFRTTAPRATIYSLARYYEIKVSVRTEIGTKWLRVWRVS